MASQTTAAGHPSGNRTTVVQAMNGPLDAHRLTAVTARHYAVAGDLDAVEDVPAMRTRQSGD